LENTVPAAVSGAVDVAAGVHFTLALNGDGSVTVWSRDGSPVPPVPAAARNNVVSVAAGSYHAIALKNDGTVVAWAISNDIGQANLPPGLSRVRAIAAGNLHSLALLEDGTITAWGSNGSGERTVPSGLNGVKAIAAGGNHSLALRTNGTVIAWGRNDSGQATVPAGIGPVVSIAAGDLHSVAVIQGGTVVAWGANGAGQTTVPTGLPAIRSVAAGRDHTLALTTGGEVRAWGRVYDGTDYVPVRVPTGLSGVSRIAAGQTHSVALVGQPLRPPSISQHPTNVTARPGELVRFAVVAAGADLLTYQWRKGGVNLPGATDREFIFNVVESGQAGPYSVVVSTSEGGSTNSLPAVLTVVPRAEIGSTVVGWGVLNAMPGLPQHSADSIEALDDVVSISCGEGFLVGLTADGRVKAWPAGPAATAVPTDLGEVVALDSGHQFTLALLRNGSVVGWGDNSQGQISIPAGLGPVTAVSGGDLHSVALRTNGTVVAWGYNAWGQTLAPAGLNRITAISAGGYHTLALREDGRVFAWGFNDAGQSSVPAAALEGVAAIAAGRNHSLALKADGTVVGWGSNLNPAGGESTPPVGLTGVRAIAAGYYSSVALLNDGTVVEWGSGFPGIRRYGPASAICAGSRQFARVINRSLGLPAVSVSWPPSVDLTVGEPVRLAPEVTGLQPLQYQWRFDGADISRATNSWLDLEANQTGTYTLVALNRFGITLGEPVHFVVHPESGPEVYLWDYVGQLLPVPPFLRGVRSVAKGNSVSVDLGGYYAVKTNGLVVGWGTTSAESNRVAELRNVVSISSSTSHTLALHADGSVSGWAKPGYNFTPVAAGFSNVVAIAAGENYSLALDASGNAAGWGAITLPERLANVAALRVLGPYWVILHRDGTVLASHSTQYIPIPPDVTGLMDVSFWHGWAAAVQGDGTLVQWGGGAPGPLPTGNDFVAVNAATGLGVALRRNGTLAVWGSVPPGTVAAAPSLPGRVIQFDAQGNASIGSGTLALVRREIGPTLGYSSGPDGLALVWPTEPAGYLLESSPSLRPTAWRTVGGVPPGESGTNRWVVVPNEAALFFRLLKP
jgi:alpha-tubulin suppressor-like RCC1 family protein